MNIDRHAPHLDPEPCNFDGQILPDLILAQQLAKEKKEQRSFQFIPCGQKDWDTVCKLYENSSVEGKVVAKVQVIVNPLFSEEFHPRLKLLEERGKLAPFQPSWKSESQTYGSFNTQETKMRQRVNDTLDSIAKYPLGFKHVKVVNMFHGPGKGAIEGICCANLASLSLTDPGYFGKGVYHTSSARYAYRYAQNTRESALIMSWICFSSAYPVIHHPEVNDDVRDPDNKGWKQLSNELKKKHWLYLAGRQGAIAEKYNAHYVLVCPKNPKDPEEVDFYPFIKNAKHTYDELVTFDASQVLPRYLVTLAPDVLNIKFPFYTPKYFYETLKQVTHPQALVNELSQKVFQNELSNGELIELGHLLCLNKITNVEIRNESVRYLEINRAIERVRKQYPLPISMVTFDEIFQPCASFQIIKVGKTPFELVQNWIDANEFDKAMNALLPLFRADTDIGLCYTYLFLLLQHVTKWSTLANNLPYLLARSSDCREPHRQLAIELASYYTTQKAIPDAIQCYAKALSLIESRKIHELTSALLIKIIYPHVQTILDQSDNCESFLKKIDSLQRFCMLKDDRDSFYELALNKMNNLPRDLQNQYTPSIEKVLQLLGNDFNPPELTTTQRYWNAFNAFTIHFTIEIDDVRSLQYKATRSFVDFFEILLDDAFLLLGAPPCNYDIRVGGPMGREEISPNASLDCIILVDQGNIYFKSLIEVLTVQLLSVGKKATFKIIQAQEDFQNSALQTISLATSNCNLFNEYQKKCWTLPSTRPTLDQQAFNIKWPKKITLGYIRKHYHTPLIQFISDLILYHKIEHKNLLDGIDALKDAFTENSRVLLKESVGFLYTLFLSYNEDTLVSSLQENEITALQKCHWLVLSPLSSTLYTGQGQINLDTLAQTKGFYLLYEEAQFRK
ncbi:MAG: hypothetical protein H0T62_06810, partial [Parachlamydiaceae bacterium]|nr:hypothetical protein [Parachlamydiaceae bacterium]